MQDDTYSDPTQYIPGQFPSQSSYSSSIRLRFQDQITVTVTTWETAPSQRLSVLLGDQDIHLLVLPANGRSMIGSETTRVSGKMRGWSTLQDPHLAAPRILGTVNLVL